MIRKLLISGAAIDLTDHKGNTPFHIACQYSSTRMLDEMVHYVPLQAVLKTAQIRNNEGLSCVHVAAKNGNTDILAKLKNLSVDMNIQVGCYFINCITDFQCVCKSHPVIIVRFCVLD